MEYLAAKKVSLKKKTEINGIATHTVLGTGLFFSTLGDFPEKRNTYRGKETFL
jgi:hypothetical protein